MRRKSGTITWEPTVENTVQIFDSNNTGYGKSPVEVHKNVQGVRDYGDAFSIIMPNPNPKLSSGHSVAVYSKPFFHFIIKADTITRRTR